MENKLGKKKSVFAFTVLILVEVLNLELMLQSLMNLNIWPVSGSLYAVWWGRVCVKYGFFPCYSSTVSTALTMSKCTV